MHHVGPIILCTICAISLSCKTVPEQDRESESQLRADDGDVPSDAPAAGSPLVLDTAAQRQAFAEEIRGVFDFFEGRLKQKGIGKPVLSIDLDPANGADIFTKARYSDVVNGLRENCEVFIIGGAFAGLNDKLAALFMITHELGHLVGSGPLADHVIAVEGEADYLAGPLLREFLLSHPQYLSGESDAARLETEIANVFTERQLNFDALQVRVAAAGYLALINASGADIDLRGFDSSVVSATSDDYPSPQARWNTVVAGLFGLERPRSWALPSDFPQ